MDVEQRARDALNEVYGQRGRSTPWTSSDKREKWDALETVCRLIEQHDAYKREVNDAVLTYFGDRKFVPETFSRFIHGAGHQGTEPMTDLAKLSAGAGSAAQIGAACAVLPEPVMEYVTALVDLHCTGQLVERDGVAGVVDGVRKFLEMLEHGYAPFVEGALSAAMCCDGKMCGCRGASVGEYLAHLLRAETSLDRINRAALTDLIADTADHPEPNYRGDSNV